MKRLVEPVIDIADLGKKSLKVDDAAEVAKINYKALLEDAKSRVLIWRGMLEDYPDPSKRGIILRERKRPEVQKRPKNSMKNSIQTSIDEARERYV